MRNWFPKLVSLLLAIAIWFLIRNYIDDINRERPFNSDGRRFQDGAPPLLGSPDHEQRRVPKAGRVEDDDSDPPPKATRVLEPQQQHPKKAIPVEE